MFGQEAPLAAERNPRSLASVGVPDFTSAGNLWLWIPQVRLTAEYGYTLRLAVQAAMLAPIAGTQGLTTTQDDSGERATRPYLETQHAPGASVAHALAREAGADSALLPRFPGEEPGRHQEAGTA